MGEENISDAHSSCRNHIRLNRQLTDAARIHLKERQAQRNIPGTWSHPESISPIGQGLRRACRVIPSAVQPWVEGPCPSPPEAQVASGMSRASAQHFGGGPTEALLPMQGR